MGQKFINKVGSGLRQRGAVKVDGVNGFPSGRGRLWRHWMSACGGMGVLFKSGGARSHTQYQDWNQSPEWGLDFFSRVHQGMKLGVGVRKCTSPRLSTTTLEFNQVNERVTSHILGLWKPKPWLLPGFLCTKQLSRAFSLLGVPERSPARAFCRGLYCSAGRL